jgi:hypothetical protein
MISRKKFIILLAILHYDISEKTGVANIIYSQLKKKAVFF